MPEKLLKVGLDDFLLVAGPDGWQKLVEQSEAPEGLGILQRLNKDFAWLDEQPGRIIRLKDGKVMSAKQFQDFTSPIPLIRGLTKLNAGYEWMNFKRCAPLRGNFFCRTRSATRRQRTLSNLIRVSTAITTGAAGPRRLQPKWITRLFKYISPSATGYLSTNGKWCGGWNVGLVTSCYTRQSSSRIFRL
jgi:hypothetical protein